jgi:hypothetical protein
MDQFEQINEITTQFDHPEPQNPIIPPNPPSNALNALALPPLATYPSREALFEAIQAWAKPRGYAFITGKSKRLESGRYRVYYACDRMAPIRPNIATNRLRDTHSRGTGCPFSNYI